MTNPCCCGRDVVLVVGSTGSLGKPIATELQRRQGNIRLLGRSHESFAQAGLATDQWDLKVYSRDVGKGSSFPDEWFLDVKAVICVARPRWSEPDDRNEFEEMIQKLSTAVTKNGVPDMLLLGRPFVSAYTFGMTENMKAYEKAELYAKRCFVRCKTGSHLTIVRIGEISEIGHLLEIAQRTHAWICVRGYNPYLQPIDETSFAVAVANFVEEKRPHPAVEVSELLIGGNEIITWRDLGNIVSEELPSKAYFLDVPLCAIKLMIWFFHLCAKFFPIFHGFENVLRITGIPMTADSTSEKHERVGNISIRHYVRSRIRCGQGSDVRKHINAVRHGKKSIGSVFDTPTFTRVALSFVLVLILVRFLAVLAGLGTI